jgi:hypothetical protein
MSVVIEGVYKQEGLADTVLPLAVDSQGRLSTTATAVVTSEVEITNDSGNAIPTEPLGIPSVARQVAVSTTSASQALTSTCKRISIKARLCDMRFVVGTGSLTAVSTSSHFLGQDERLDIAVPLAGSIAVIRDNSSEVNGSLEITELV